MIEIIEDQGVVWDKSFDEPIFFNFRPNLFFSCTFSKPEKNHISSIIPLINTNADHGILYGRKYYKKLSNIALVDVRHKNLKMIGAGAYGLVCKATDTVTGEEVAIKKVRDVFTDLVDAKRILRELKLLMHLGNITNIVHIRDIMINPPNSEDFEDLYIVTNKYDCDLYRILNSGQTLTDDHFSWFLYQLLCGLKYVPLANVMHRDLKPSNLLVNANCDLALCDFFGLARGEPGPGVAMTEYVVTRWYRAPGVALHEHDVRQYGRHVECGSDLCGDSDSQQPLLQGKDYMDQLSRIIKLVGAVSDEDMKCIQVDGAREMVSALSKKYPTPKDFSEFFAPYVVFERWCSSFRHNRVRSARTVSRLRHRPTTHSRITNILRITHYYRRMLRNT